MNKAEQFKQATSKLTYADVVRMFNDLNKILHTEFYAANTDLIDHNGIKVPGFVYTGYAAGVGLRRILETLNIGHSTLLKRGDGLKEEAEIHIDPEDAKRMLEIFERCGLFKSNVSIEINRMVAKNKLDEQIR